MFRFTMFSVALALTILFAAPVRAQDQTLADIRQELSVLFVEIQRLKRELSTTGGTSAGVGGASTLERLDSIESELSRLTAKTEQLENRVNRVVADGTNRIGDLEFRLVELEGGDISKLGETSTLGGGSSALPVITPRQGGSPDSGGGELAMSEQGDFDRAKADLDAGKYQNAADAFAKFAETYTGGPLTGDAHYYRGRALFALGDTGNAARAYLESFSGSPDSQRAPDALFELGVSLSTLGQVNEACVSLAEVGVRFPGTAAARDAAGTYQQLGCS